jgi:hypothetical protein
MILLFSTEDDDILLFLIHLSQGNGEVSNESYDIGTAEMNVNNSRYNPVICKKEVVKEYCAPNKRKREIGFEPMT